MILDTISIYIFLHCKSFVIWLSTIKSVYLKEKLNFWPLGIY